MKKGWEEQPLAEVCSVLSGLWKGKTKPFQTATVIRNTNFTKECRLDLEDVAVLEVEVRQLVKRRLLPGDLVLEKSGGGPKQPVGRVVYFDQADGVYSFSNFTSVLRVKDSAVISPVYLQRYLYWQYVAGITEKMQRRSTGIRNLDMAAYMAIPVRYPPLPEQRRIVAILDEAFEGIAAAKANAERNLRNARDVFHNRLAATFVGQGEEWMLSTLESLVSKDCTLSYGIVQPGDEVSGGLPVIRPVDLKEAMVGLSGVKRINPVRAKAYRRTVLQGGEVLLCVRGTTGIVALAAGELAGANVTRGIVPIRFDNSILESSFGLLAMRSPHVQAQIQEKTTGTALKQINIGELRKVRLPHPPRARQASISDALSMAETHANQVASLYGAKLTALDELKASLLHQAFTGQL